MRNLQEILTRAVFITNLANYFALVDVRIDSNTKSDNIVLWVTHDPESEVFDTYPLFEAKLIDIFKCRFTVKLTDHLDSYEYREDEPINNLAEIGDLLKCNLKAFEIASLELTPEEEVTLKQNLLLVDGYKDECSELMPSLDKAGSIPCSIAPIRAGRPKRRRDELDEENPSSNGEVFGAFFQPNTDTDKAKSPLGRPKKRRKLPVAGTAGDNHEPIGIGETHKGTHVPVR